MKMKINLTKPVSLSKRQPKHDSVTELCHEPRHRRYDDGLEHIFGQVVIGHDGRLYRFSEPYHTWVGVSLSEAYPTSAPALRQALAPVGW